VSAYTYLSFFATFFRIVFIVQYYEYPFESDIMFDLHPELFNLAGACDAAGSEQRPGLEEWHDRCARTGGQATHLRAFRGRK
jgi:hypothetical protein